MRHLFAGGRQSGKTTQMIEAVKRDPTGVMVVISQAEATRLNRLGLSRIQTHVLGGSAHLGGSTGAYVDNADLVLAHVLGVPVEAMAVGYKGFRYSPAFDGEEIDRRLALTDRYEDALRAIAGVDGDRGRVRQAIETIQLMARAALR